jgi:hypothetical protein
MFHCPMSAYMNRMLSLNFSLVHMIEPQLSPKTVAEYPNYRRDAHIRRCSETSRGRTGAGNGGLYSWQARCSGQTQVPRLCSDSASFITGSPIDGGVTCFHNNSSIAARSLSAISSNSLDACCSSR